MWKFKPFIQFVKDMVEVPSIGEIIIFDNDPENGPSDSIFSHSKVNCISFGKNIYVNPAWNAGTRIAKYENICLLNDDVIVDLKLFDRMDKFLKPGIGLCGICPGLQQEFGHTPITTGEIELVHTPFPYNPRTHFGIGTLMFYPKEEYIPIIDGLDLYWGDNFIYDTLFLKLNQNYHIVNTFYYTPYAVTTSTIANSGEILSREHEIYNREMPQLLEKIRVENAYRTGLN
jgi:hypothetical protein